jgi:hypothetical protein
VITTAPLVDAAGLLSGKPHFLHWGVVQISVMNLAIIVLMVLLFVLALVLPFPGSHGADEEHSDDRG